MAEDILKQQFTRLVGVVGTVTVLTLIALWAYPHVDPENEYQLLRSLLARLANVNIGGAYLLFWLVLVDFVTPGDFLAKVEEDATACSILGAAVCIALSLMYIYY